MTTEHTTHRRTSQVIEIQIGHDVVCFTVDDDPARSHYGLAIEGSYGGYAYSWSMPGKSFHEFLAGLDASYVGGKMVGRDEVMDGKRMAGFIREIIVLARLQMEGKSRKHTVGYGSGHYFGESIGSEEARIEYDMVPEEFEHEVEFMRWIEDTEFFSGWDHHHDLYFSKPGSRAEEFTNMFERFWPAFAAELKNTPAKFHRVYPQSECQADPIFLLQSRGWVCTNIDDYEYDEAEERLRDQEGVPVDEAYREESEDWEEQWDVQGVFFDRAEAQAWGDARAYRWGKHRTYAVSAMGDLAKILAPMTWPTCIVDGCERRCCLALKSKLCHPCTTRARMGGEAASPRREHPESEIANER